MPIKIYAAHIMSVRGGSEARAAVRVRLPLLARAVRGEELRLAISQPGFPTVEPNTTRRVFAR